MNSKYLFMNTIKSTLIAITTSLLIFSCNKTSCELIPTVQSDICIDTNLIGNAVECIEIYDPVCGCDGITYDNYCVADSSGITSYVAGECCD